MPFIAPDRATATECDVFVPCAVGGILNAASIAEMSCRAVAGSANNQLLEPEDAARLAARHILYAPDFVANVGGAMAITGIEALGWTTDQAEKEVGEYVLRTLHRIFDTAEAEGISTDEAARRIAEEHLRP